ncbi:type II secretion system F family protein [Actinorhabdospora filicis]|uniref:type II secretion system F family protein n=1 Tax=Actinorhabdospora filicis TaxID=1785913 RepID=UPI002552B6BE|nr:hypothetical protein [Actinorhabdospora filicis]
MRPIPQGTAPRVTRPSSSAVRRLPDTTRPTTPRYRSTGPRRPVLALPSRERRRLAALRPARPAPSLHRYLAARFPVESDAALAWAALAAGIAGALWHGPVAGLLAAIYASALLLAVRRARRERRVTAARDEARRAIGELAAELRAGAPAHRATREALARLPHHPGAALAERRLTTALTVAEATGAPCAEILDRLEADLHAVQRAASRAAVRVSGARASTGLLAALPLAGLALGSALGGDVTEVLFHTPLGAVCALAAVVLQILGLLWARRLSTPMEVTS